jgi:DNA-binding SARP family transcriptional activator
LRSGKAKTEHAAPRRQPRRATEPAPERPLSRRALFHGFPCGLVLVDGLGRVLALNERSEEFLGVESDGVLSARATCCELVCAHLDPPWGGECLTRLAVSREAGSLGEIRVRAGERSAWVSAANVGNGRARVLLHVRAATRDAGGSVPDPGALSVRIHALGRLRVETGNGAADDEWLQQRPGQLLKYLVSQRARPVANEQIADALWPEASHRDALTRVRQYVHQLRISLEPDRRPGSRSSFIGTRRGGYALENVWVDADEFTRSVEAGLRAYDDSDLSRARFELDVARRLYRGDFLAGDPYAEWALVERDRLRELSSRGLRTLVELEFEAGRVDVAADRARALTEVDTFDGDVWRRYLELCLRRGRRSEAARQYGLLKDRMRRQFGQEPDFTLRDVSAAAAGDEPQAGSLLSADPTALAAAR